MSKCKWARLAVGAIFLAAAATGIRAGAENPADAEQNLAREVGPRDDRGPPRGDDRGPPPRERGPGQFNSPPRGEFRPDDRGPREEGREGRRPEGPGRSEGRGVEGREGRPGNREDGPPPRPELGSVLPPFVRGQIKLTDEQQKQIEELQQDVQSKLKTILTADQISRAEEAMRQGPPRPNGADQRGPEERRSRGPEGRGPDAREPGPGPGERGDGPRRFDGPRDGNFRDGGLRDGGGPGGPREGRRGPDDDRREGPPPRDGGRRPPEDDRRSEAPKDLKSSLGAKAPA